MLLFQLSAAELAGIAVALIVGITFHEFSHAYVADQLGDHRPRALGRVSLNPTHHIDPLGAVFFLVAGFGWGKPVPVNIGALRPGRIGMALVSAAGPLANVVVAIAAAIIYRVMDIGGVGGFPLQIVESIVFFNLLLAIFNLIPIPPLDGSKVMFAFMDRRTEYQIRPFLEQWGFFILLALLFIPPGNSIGGRIIIPITDGIFSFLVGV
jgi:Zn-dependent protease